MRHVLYFYGMWRRLECIFGHSLEVVSRGTSQRSILPRQVWHQFIDPGRMEGFAGLGGNPNQELGIGRTRQPAHPPIALRALLKRLKMILEANTGRAICLQVFLFGVKISHQQNFPVALIRTILVPQDVPAPIFLPSRDYETFHLFLRFVLTSSIIFSSLTV